jgi:hypothetical protein
MSTERHRDLTFPRKRHGAGSVGQQPAGPLRCVASQLRSSSPVVSPASVVCKGGRVAFIRAGLRSALRRRCRVASTVAAYGRVAVRSESSGLSAGHCLRVGRWPNNSLEPTPVVNEPSLSVGSGAAQLSRWAAGMSMSSERHPLLTFPRKRHGAASVGGAARCAVPGVALRLRSISPATSGATAVSKLGRVASFRAGLRLSLRRRLVAGSFVAVLRNVTVPSESTGLPQPHRFQFGRLPNNSLVPTPATEARFVSLGSGAAQLKR